MLRKIIPSIFLGLFLLMSLVSPTFAGWVDGYFRSDGTYVNGYYRTEPDLYKWNNYSFDNDWSDIYNDNSYYRDYGYDPEPYDDDYVSPYSTDSYYNSTYDYDYDYDYDSYDSNYDWSYDSYDYDSSPSYSNYESSYDTYDYGYSDYDSDWSWPNLWDSLFDWLW